MASIDARLLSSLVGLAALACTPSPPPTTAHGDDTRDSSAASDAARRSDVSAVSDASEASDAPAPAGRDCSRGVLAKGSTWTVERDGEFSTEGCYGRETPWVGRVVLRERVLEVLDGHPTRLALTYEDGTSQQSFADGITADFTAGAAPGCARVTHTSDGGVEDLFGFYDEGLLAVFSAPCSMPDAKEMRTIPEASRAIAIRFRNALSLGDQPWQRFSITPRGIVERPFGRTRAFAVDGAITNGGAGMCHHWTTALRGSGMLYLAEKEDVIVEASFDGTVDASDGTCMGCGPSHNDSCPERRCARGPTKVRLRLRCD